MCIFCSIVNNEIPSYKVYEDENVLAFLDISQTTKGHTVVIPKKHVTNILDTDEETYMNVVKVVRPLANKIVKNLKANGCNILHNANECAGQSVGHMHFHIIPRYDDSDSIHFSFDENASKPDLAVVLEEISGK